eukprot:PhM_4_TR17386/c0_g3_i5/m.32776
MGCASSSQSNLSTAQHHQREDLYKAQQPNEHNAESLLPLLLDDEDKEILQRVSVSPPKIEHSALRNPNAETAPTSTSTTSISRVRFSIVDDPTDMAHISSILSASTGELKADLRLWLDGEVEEQPLELPVTPYSSVRLPLSRKALKMHLEVLDEERLRKEAAEMATRFGYGHNNKNNDKHYSTNCKKCSYGVDVDSGDDDDDDDDDDCSDDIVTRPIGSSSLGSLRRPLSSSRHRAISHMEEDLFVYGSVEFE